MPTYELQRLPTTSGILHTFVKEFLQLLCLANGLSSEKEVLMGLSAAKCTIAIIYENLQAGIHPSRI